MLSCMRTTLNVDDGLLQEAKRRAVEEQRTLTSLVEEGLRRVLAPAPARGERIRLPTFRGDGTQPGVDLADWESVQQAAYADEEAAYRSAAPSAAS